MIFNPMLTIVEPPRLFRITILSIKNMGTPQSSPSVLVVPRAPIQVKWYRHHHAVEAVRCMLDYYENEEMEWQEEEQEE